MTRSTLLSRITLASVPALILASLPATTGCPYCGEGAGTIVHDVDLGATTNELIARCEADTTDCIALCGEVVTEMGEYYADIIECTLTRTGAELLLRVRYYDGSVC